MSLTDKERDVLAFVMLAADDLIGAPPESPSLRYLPGMVSGALAALWADPEDLPEESDEVVALARQWVEDRPPTEYQGIWERYI